MTGEANSEGGYYIEPRGPGNLVRVPGNVSSVYAIQVAQQPGGLETALEVWRRRKWLAILIFLEVFTVAASITMFLPNVYQSTATILIERQKVPDAYVQSTVTGGIDFRLQSLTEEVLSRSRLENLMDDLNLYQDLRQRVPLEQVIERMRKDIVLGQNVLQKEAQGETTIAFTVSYKGRNPQQVAQVANTVAAFYVNENLKAREQQAGETENFLRTQLDEMQQRQEEQEQRLRQYKELYMGELPEQLQTNMGALESLNARLRVNSEKQARVSQQRTAMAEQLAELQGFKVPSKHTIVVASDPQLNTYVAQREKLQQELAKLSTRYGEKHPAIVSLNKEIEILDTLLTKTASPESDTKSSRQALGAAQNPYMQRLKRELDESEAALNALQAEEQALLQSVALYKQRVENTPARDQELQVLQRDYESAKGLYQSMLKRQEEAKLSKQLEQRQKGEQFRLLEQALPAVRPKEPARLKLLLLGFAGALGLAVGALVLLERVEQLRPSFHTVADLSAFSQVPVLVSLPYIVTRADLRHRRWRFGLAVLSIILCVVLIAGAYVVINNPGLLFAL